MVDKQGYNIPHYSTPTRRVDGNKVRNMKSTNKVKNPAAINAMSSESHILSNPVFCQNCELNFIDVDEYEKHAKNKCIRKHICTYCNASFQRNDHLKRHIVSVHSNTKCNICPLCNEDCKNYDLLLKHVKVHPNESVCHCHECGQEFKSLHELVVHKLTHVWPECHVCSYCSKVFKRRDHMLRHIQTLHLQQHTACPICSQKFKRKDHTLRHIREKHRMAIPNGGLKEFQEKLMSVSQ
ncbi:jg10271 [Pararge aegeria aegeria]|uniref:Jg10271 protein n=1 Tax=Pararge aegeria aegeria TaxID=348720 RepID=A0A8S4R4V1_9NEOP|nr:jg10271 [Pararge aegeria aegeria]